MGLYKPFTAGDDIYTSRKIMIPASELYVLYNGVEKRPARWTMRLSDSFRAVSDALEVKVQAININYSPRHKILQKSSTLLAYSVFVDQARKGKARGLSYEEALKNAVRYCIEHGYMAEYFMKKQEEVVRVMKIQWNMDDALRVRGEEGYEDGHEEGRLEGRKEGREEGRLEMIKNLLKAKTPLEYIQKASGWSEDEILALGAI